jgi:CheY-like chemotaxis protein
MAAKKKILIVDDEFEFLSFLKETLELRGYEVIATTNAVEAGMELASKLPSLILMDLKMPGIDGLQACEAIRRNPATGAIPIIIVTGLLSDSYRKKATKLGVVEYFNKPVDMTLLINKVNEILGSSQ